MDVRLGLPRIDGELQPARARCDDELRADASPTASLQRAVQHTAAWRRTRKAVPGGHHPDVPYRDRADPRHQAVSGLAVSMTWKDHSWEWLGPGGPGSAPGGGWLWVLVFVPAPEGS